MTAVEFDDSDWKKALFVMASDFDWKKICVLLAQEDPAKLYDLAMQTLMPEEKPKEEDRPYSEMVSLEARVAHKIETEGMIAGIKEYRAITGLVGLKESKEFVENLVTKYPHIKKFKTY